LHDFEEAVRLAPHDPLYIVAMANVNVTLRRYEEADELFERALAINPERTATLLSHGLFYISLGDTDAARRVINQVPSGDHSIWVQIILVTLDLAEGKLEDGLARLTSAEGSPVTAMGDSTDYYLYKAEIYKRMGDPTRARICADSARGILQRILTGDLKTWDEAMNRKQMARALVLLGRHEEAIREAETAVRMLPVSKDALDGWELVLELAYVHAAVGEYDQAIDQLERVMSHPNYYSADFLKINPDFVMLHGNPRFNALIEKGHTVF
jgi:tetratricopeptide (TPR) repeat protein